MSEHRVLDSRGLQNGAQPAEAEILADIMPAIPGVDWPAGSKRLLRGWVRRNESVCHRKNQRGGCAHQALYARPRMAFERGLEEAVVTIQFSELHFSFCKRPADPASAYPRERLSLRSAARAARTFKFGAPLTASLVNDPRVPAFGGQSAALGGMMTRYLREDRKPP